MGFMQRIKSAATSLRVNVRDKEIIGRIPKPYPLEKFMVLPEDQRNDVLIAEARVAAAVHDIYVQKAGHFAVTEKQEKKQEDSTARLSEIYLEHRLASDKPEADRFAETFALNAEYVYTHGRAGGRV